MEIFIFVPFFSKINIYTPPLIGPIIHFFGVGVGVDAELFIIYSNSEYFHDTCNT